VVIWLNLKTYIINKIHTIHKSYYHIRTSKLHEHFMTILNEITLSKKYIDLLTVIETTVYHLK